MSQAARRGGEDGPITPDAFKRTVCKRAPKHFHVDLLPPEKHSNSYSYGFRVFPLKDDNASISARSTSSHGSVVSFNEYDVWRKWEDCLWFQDSLENAYSRLAREKRNRLAAGKGIKKNGVYIHSDQAASWESLPFGPDPDAIARDIHEYIPKLSKKATIFRASQETLNQRYEELFAMMGVLLSDDLPTLIKDIKATSAFTDFFGVWRRDVELARKAAAPKKSTSAEPRQSISNSIRSAFPGSPASQSVMLPSPDKGKAPERQVPFRVLASSDSSSEDFADSLRPSRMMNRGQEIPSGRSRASSSDSRSSASLPSTPVAMSPLTSRVPLAASQEMPLRFGHNPLSGERHPYSLQSLPEDCEFAPSRNSSLHERSPRKRAGSTVSSINRNARVYVPSPSSSVEFNEPPSELPPRSLSRYTRASFQSRYSSTDLRATAYLDELDVDYCLPSATPVPRGHPRASVCSMASIVTNSSVDAVIPRNDRHLARNNRPRSDSLAEEPEDGPWSENESPSDDLLDAYFYDADVVTSDTTAPQDYPETPLTCRFGDRLSIAAPSSSSRYYDCRSSFSSHSTSTSSLSSGNPGVLSIKAMHEEEIVVLRLPSYISFQDLRRKIYDKFSKVERPTISESFAIALVEQAPPTSLQGYPKPKGGRLRFISSQVKWADIVATQQSNKITLRIIGSRE